MAQNWQFHNPVFESNPFNPWWMSASPWSTNRRFAYDLTRFIKPKVVAELGVHCGCSLFTFAQAAKDGMFDSRIYGIDTWQGDEQAGHYDENVLRGVELIRRSVFTDQHISLLQKTFSEALGDFKDNTIDLLHIDGLHTYEAVSEDFATWLPKLKPNGIILFHDVTANAAENGYGSVRFWNEITEQYPNLQLTHNWGLGILFPKGDDLLRSMNKNGVPHFLRAYETISMIELTQWLAAREAISHRNRATEPAENTPDKPLPSTNEHKPRREPAGKNHQRTVAAATRLKSRLGRLKQKLTKTSS